MSVKFKNIQELYQRIRPALQTKVNEMKRKGYNYIQVEDVWNYLRLNKWNNASNLTLSEMVNDILTVDEKKIDEYVKSYLYDLARNADMKEDQDGTR